jgi:hypothetical protein
LTESNAVSKVNDSAVETAETKDMTQGKGGNAPAFNMRKQISSTTYEVEVYFSPASRETLDEKILRLARGEALNEGAGGSGENK